jgi:hypothetical protein
MTKSIKLYKIFKFSLACRRKEIMLFEALVLARAEPVAI